MPAAHDGAIFATELILLIFLGRALGEGMARIGQPAIFGQLLAGIVLGPSVFGALSPELQHTIFPGTPALKSMVDAISQIGILLLLLLTGMETKLGLINRERRAVISTSVSGIAVPFVCGMMIVYLMPQRFVPARETLLATALFFGTALSVSSVKIVAMVLMEVGAIRRDLGQLILATAILDDTIAWVLIAVISGIATSGAIEPGRIGTSIGLTILFLGLSFTIGRRFVAWLIRWSNDAMTIEAPVISAILVVMLAMALTTDLIGVHTALGAFVAGILVGRSPILTEHIEGELRGFIVAFFSPVFFGLAGLGVDLRSLLEPSAFALTLTVIAVASIGKFIGALAGGRIGGLTGRESIALATALNARGSTEVIIASIGLSMGVLSDQLFSMIVAMAMTTTMLMPPTLRWMIERVPLREAEARRMEREEAEQDSALPDIERALVYVDGSANGALAARLAGCFTGGRQIATTVIDSTDHDAGRPAQRTGIAIVTNSAEQVAERSADAREDVNDDTQPVATDELVLAKKNQGLDDLKRETAKSYDIVFTGIGRPIVENANRFGEAIQMLVETSQCPIAVVLNGHRFEVAAGAAIDILVPTGGGMHSRLATEIGLAIAKATGGTLTVLHVVTTEDQPPVLHRSARRLGMSVLVQARQLGRVHGVTVQARMETSNRPDAVIADEMASGRFDLVVVGALLRSGKNKFLGPRTATLIRGADCPTLLIAMP